MGELIDGVRASDHIGRLGYMDHAVIDKVFTVPRSDPEHLLSR